MYLNIDRVEFLATYHCTGKCAHCSIGEKLNKPGMTKVDPKRAREVLEGLSKRFALKSVMVFGGEPLLYPETTAAIIKAAADCGVEKRQLITNGYFSKNIAKINDVAQKLVDAGVTEILLSVDAFHEETIPSDTVAHFADAVLDTGFQEIYLHPSWLGGKDAKNDYNFMTTQILERFDDLGLEVTEGNDVMPEGNAKVNLSEYFIKGNYEKELGCGVLAYTDKLDDVHTLSITPDGEVQVCGFTIGNIYRDPIEKIIDRYNPTKDRSMNAILKGGIKGLAQYAENKGIEVDLDEYYSICDACRGIREKLNELLLG